MSRFLVTLFFLFSLPSTAFAELVFDLGNCRVTGTATLPLTALGSPHIDSGDWRSLSEHLGRTEDIFEDLIGRKPDQEFDLHGYSEGGFLYHDIVEVVPATGSTASTILRPFIVRTTNPNLSTVRSLAFVEATLGQDYYSAGTSGNTEIVDFVLCGKYFARLFFNLDSLRVEREAISIWLSPDALPASMREPTAPTSAPARSTACDHVYIGKEFEARGGVLRLKQRYIVMGVSERSGLVTIRGKHSDHRQEVTCLDIP